MNRAYHNKFVMWEVHDDGEEKLGEYETFQEFAQNLPYYYAVGNMGYTFGCLSWYGQISHIELRFNETPLYSVRQEDWLKNKREF